MCTHITQYCYPTHVLEPRTFSFCFCRQIPIDILESITDSDGVSCQCNFTYIVMKYKKKRAFDEKGIKQLNKMK